MISRKNYHVGFFVVIMLISTVSSQTRSEFDYRTMKAYGTNLGGWLTLERWISPDLFRTHAPNAIDEWTFTEQASNPAQALEQHWSTWVTEEEIRTLASVNGNHLRIPVGWWAFIEPDDGEPYVCTGQKAHLERVLGYMNTYNIYGFIDLHGMPGSQNGEHHSGRTGEIEFYSEYNQNRSLNTIRAVVDWVNRLNPTLKSRISGIQPVNEPHVIAGHQDWLTDFYKAAYDIINASPYKIPMIFHDGFQGLEPFAGFLSPDANAVIDIHPYHAFPPNPNRTSILIHSCAKKDQNLFFHLPIFFGEWSLASGLASDNITWLTELMDSQVYGFKNGGCGFGFWTIKNHAVKHPSCDNRRQDSRQVFYDCFEGIAWSFVQLVAEGVITNRTFSETPNHQCGSAGMSTSNIYLLMACLMVCIKMIMHKLQ